MQLIDERGAEILPDRRHATPDPDVPVTRGRLGSLQRGVNAVGDEPELRPARHGERSTWVVGQHEDGSVIRRLLAPPAPPAVIRPRAADGPEHIAAENPSADPGQALGCNLVVDARLAVCM